jgi:hypothetical protein
MLAVFTGASNRSSLIGRLCLPRLSFFAALFLANCSAFSLSRVLEKVFVRFQ